jgi:ankyrin repeat protein
MVKRKFVDNYLNLDLNQAVIREDFDLVKFLIDDGADLNSMDDDGNTPLIHAILLNNVHMVELLLNYGADPNIEIDRTTPLIVAVSGEEDFNIEIVRLLLEAGADPNIGYRRFKTALIHAVDLGFADAVELMIRLPLDRRMVNNAIKLAIKNLKIFIEDEGEDMEEIQDDLRIIELLSEIVDIDIDTRMWLQTIIRR